jgi:MEDS: MEthanogen/methylotroph, DcmR Sensory domain
MDPTDDKANFRGNIPTESSRPIRSVAQCLALNFISARSFTVMRKNTVCCCRLSKRGFARGEKVFHIVDPARRDDHLRRLASAGIDVTAIRQRGQFELRTWTDTHLCNGRSAGRVFKGAARTARTRLSRILGRRL